MRKDPVTVTTWAEFLEKVEEIKDEYRTLIQRQPNLEFVKPLLFRGQKNAEWGLKTTLERNLTAPISIQHYYYLAAKHSKEIESYLNSDWNVPYNVDLSQMNRGWSSNLPHLEYLIYLRHHGFPSPLLDWTESVNIAAYFAFIDSETDVAIYCFNEMPENLKHYHGGPYIGTIGPNIKTDIRHHRQKAHYTFGATTDNEEMLFFHNHEDVIDHPIPESNQDVLHKFILPKSLKQEVLRYLNDHNITHYTLFGGEDALIKSITTKVFDLGRNEL